MATFDAFVTGQNSPNSNTLEIALFGRIWQQTGLCCCNAQGDKESRGARQFNAFCDSFGPCYLDSFSCLFMTDLIYGFLATLA